SDRTSVRVELRDGAFDQHSWDSAGWYIEHERLHRSAKLRNQVILGGMRQVEEDTGVSQVAGWGIGDEGRGLTPHPPSLVTHPAPSPSDSHALPATFLLDEVNYRRSEESWSEAGCPTATVTVASTQRDTLTIKVDVSHVHRCFVPIDAENPLDNEPAAINGAGMQLYVLAGERQGGRLLVPDP